MKLKYRAQALADLGRIHERLSETSPRGADEAISRIHAALGRLNAFPHSGRKGLVPGTRELVVPRTPYVVVHIVNEAEGFVDIVGVFHGAQKR
jgi:toxin ParE1/3/4